MNENPYDFGLMITTPPEAEPVTLPDAKAHLKMDGINDDDSLITNIITAAREWVEAQTQRQLITATLEYRLERFPSQIVLPNPPLQQVMFVRYTDTAGVQQIMDDHLYQVVSAREPAVIVPVHGMTWPACRRQPESVQVSYKAGYGNSGAQVKAALRQAILLMIGHMYEYRQPVLSGTIVTTIPFAVESLIAPYKVYWSPP